MQAKRLSIAFVILVTSFGCSKKVELFCDESTPCENPELPFCDLEGEFAASEGITNTCIPNPFDDGDAGVCDATGDVTITITRAGGANGAVTSDVGGLDCGGTCAITVPACSALRLTATAGANATFIQWAGVCDGSVQSDCVFQPTSNTTVTATFNPAGEFLGQNTFDATGGAIARTPDGEMYIAGNFTGTIDVGGEQLTSSAGSIDYFVAKFSPTMTLRWAKRFGGTLDDRANEIVVDSTGDVLVAATENCDGEFFCPSVGVLRRLASMDGSSTELGRFQADSVTPTRLNIDGSDNIYFAGQFTGTLNLGGDPIPQPNADGFLGVFAPDGTHLRSMTIGPIGFSHVELINGGAELVVSSPLRIVDTSTGATTNQKSFSAGPLAAVDDALYTCGGFTGEIDLGGPAPLQGPSPDASMLYFAQFSASDLSLVWVRTVEPSPSDPTLPTFCKALAVDPRGFVVVGGLAKAPRDFGAGTIGENTDFGWLTSVDGRDGSHRWSTVIADSPENTVPIFPAPGRGVEAVAFDRLGNIAVVGGVVRINDGSFYFVDRYGP